MREFRFALRNTIPIFFTYLFIGIAYGILMTDSGYGILTTAASSLFIYAGSMQLVMVPMMASGASLLTLALMTLFINARHIFYGVGFVEKFRTMGAAAPYMIMSLTDETYSVLCSVKYDPGIDMNKAALLISLCNHFYWVIGSMIGACAGTYMHFDMQGIDFSLTAFFLVVVVDQWKQYGSKAPFITAAVCSAGYLALLGKDLFLIPALVTCFVVLIITRKHIDGERKQDDE